MSCRHSRYPDCPVCEDIGEQRAAGEDGDVLTDADWNRLEAGEFWSAFPGMGSA